MTQTESKPCNKFNSFKIVTIKKRIWERLYETKFFSLNTEILLEFLRLESKLFHNGRWHYSITADGKKEFLKNLCFVLIRGILPKVF